MKNSLEIKNFLIVDSAEIEIKKFTVFIGPQASGKSIVAKLLYLFYHLPEFVFNVATSRGKKRELNKAITKAFCEIFPQYAWNDKNFTIRFITDVGEISFSHKQKKALTLTTSVHYEKLFKKIFTFAAKEPAPDKLSREQIEHIQKIKEMTHESNWGFINGGGSSLFIPAGRSFFASLENNVFSFLSSNIHIDYFLKEFGMIYQRTKNMSIRFTRRDSEKMNMFTDICKKFLDGVYLQKQQKEYIRNIQTGQEVEVRDASSGQQEIMPVLFAIFKTQECFFLLEEPETHIFPSSQSEIVRYIVSRQDPNTCKKSFLFTTHSPYVLTTMNNLVYAGILEERFKTHEQTEALEKLEKIYSPEERIRKNDLSAYYFNRGEAKSIIDSETGMVDAKELDEISVKTNDKFSEMLDLELMESK